MLKSAKEPGGVELVRCEKCGLQFIARYLPPERFCGPGCWPNRMVVERPRSKVHECELCGREFKAKRLNSRYCSRECARQGRYPMTLNCEDCGRTFQAQGFRKYCSSECRSRGRKRAWRSRRDYHGE